MNYASLIREAWSTTWHHRFLWIFGLFAGAAVGTFSGIGNGNQFQYRFEPGEQIPFVPNVSAAAGQAAQWALNHPALVGAAVALAMVIGLVLLVVSLIAQGGMTEATIELARHETTSFGRAWGEGRQLFWRFAGLALICIGVAFVFAFVVAAGVVLAIGTSAIVTGPTQPAIIAYWIVVGLVAAVFAVPFFIALTIVIAFAQRSTVVENVGPIAAVRSGWQLMRAHLGASLLTWLVNLGLSFAINGGIVLVTGVVAAILVVFGLLLWNAAGFATITLVYATLGAIATLVVFLGLESIANAFFWDFWTLAYLRLIGGPPEHAG